METAIVACDQAQAEHCQPGAGIDTCVGGDKTFLGLPILVMVELASRQWREFTYHLGVGVLTHTGDLPMPRQSLKAHSRQPLLSHHFLT